jgi:signal transduction histidine kinase
MYVKLKNSAKAKEWLNRMEELAKSVPSLNPDLLYTQANFYYTFGAPAQGDAAINKLIQGYQNEKDYAKADKCYRQLIDMATKTNNGRLVARTYERYNQWTDSIKKITAADELSKVQKQYDESLQTIADKDSSLSIKTGIIVTLSIVAAILVAVLVLGAILLMRYIYLNRKLKKNIVIANEHNELKTKFIRNISAQMEPTLDTLDANLPAVKALKEFTAHIQELSDLENTLDEHYEVKEQNVLAFCEKVVDEVRPLTKSGVTIAVNAPKMGVNFNAEELETVLLHLLKNAAEYTPENGKITLEFKKRGAHSQQFIVTDSGSGIAEEQVATLFKPFTEVRDLTQGDALGLPICALKLTKMNGALSYDTSYTHGARFILDLHS